MTIWAIADIHSSKLDQTTGLPTKPMDIFGEAWTDHVGRLEAAWNDLVSADDVVIIAGDIDWALRLDDALETLRRIDSWAGTKLLIRGNHDYWWSSKATNRVRRQLPPSLHLLHNNSAQLDGFNICGAKGSPVPGGPDWNEESERLLEREVNRLHLSLDSRDAGLPTIVALHYPPFYRSTCASPLKDTIELAGVACVVYGHLHGNAAGSGPSGMIEGIEYRLVAADAVGFRPVAIARGGVLAGPVNVPA
ncbi:MAG TPA: metallophosphoesterase [Chloroflexota bacterium]|nr:metallophosphoesterase [Chloroflexota bacterium]